MPLRCFEQDSVYRRIEESSFEHRGGFVPRQTANSIKQNTIRSLSSCFIPIRILRICNVYAWLFPPVQWPKTDAWGVVSGMVNTLSLPSRLLALIAAPSVELFLSKEKLTRRRSLPTSIPHLCSTAIVLIETSLVVTREPFHSLAKVFEPSFSEI